MQKNPLRIQALFITGSLVLQYLLGMYVNLFVMFPDNATEGQLWGFAWSQPALAAHIILAFLILIGSVVLFARAVRRHSKTWMWCSFVGMLAIFAAGFSGSRFIPSQTDIFSYVMALAFIAAIAAYGWGVYVGERE